VTGWVKTQRPKKRW